MGQSYCDWRWHIKLRSRNVVLWLSWILPLSMPSLNWEPNCHSNKKVKGRIEPGYINYICDWKWNWKDWVSLSQSTSVQSMTDNIHAPPRWGGWRLETRWGWCGPLWVCRRERRGRHYPHGHHDLSGPSELWGSLLPSLGVCVCVCACYRVTHCTECVSAFELHSPAPPHDQLRGGV